MKRSLPAVAAVLVVALTATGLLLTSKHAIRLSHQVLPAASAAPGGLHQVQAANTRRGGHGHTDALAPSRQTRITQPAATAAKHFLGVAVGSHITRSARGFAHLVHAHMGLIEIYISFGKAFPVVPARRIVGRGSEPFIQLNPKRTPCRKIARGVYDGYIRQLAAAAKAFGKPVIMSFGHEMNGSWSRWSRPFTTPRQFRRAWRVIHNIFESQQVQNVTWSWDPSHGGTSARPWWPGSAYVDRIGIDGYFRPGQTFKHIFARQLSIIRRFTSKPVFIAETGVARGRGQDREINGLFKGLSQYHMAGFVYFDMNGLKVWRLQGRPAAIRAFRRDAARM